MNDAPMTGEDHYARAQSMLREIHSGGARQDPDVVLASAAVAQVHATLALAAATSPAIADPNYSSRQAALGPL